MSNKPRVYGFCDAGCRRETVLKEDFDRAATFTEIGLNNGEAIVIESPNKYKIKTNIVDGAYACTLNVLLYDNGAYPEEDDLTPSYTSGINIPLTEAYDAYRDYFYFEVLDFSYEEETYRLVYELNGQRKTYEFTETTDYSLVGISVANAIALYRFNADAEIVAKDGITPHIGKNGNWFIGDTDTGIAAGGNGGGSKYEIPTFDLSERGLPAIVPNGEYAVVETDTTDILAALNKGAVKFIVKFDIGMEIEISLVMSPVCVTASGEYSCSSINEFNGSMMVTTINAANGGISVNCTPIDNIIGAYINIALGGDY